VDAFSNIDQLFDEITYDKGESVLGMLEHWIGPEAFRAGVRDYIAAHAGGNAEATDLWSALAKHSGKDVAGVARSFVEQPGVPLVRVAPAADARLATVSQRRFIALGHPEAPAMRWRIPVTARASDGPDGGPIRHTLVLADPEQPLLLVPHAAATGPPDAARSHRRWLDPNDGESGYYRWSLDAGGIRTLADSAQHILDARERTGFVGNLSALLDAGQMRGDEALALLAHFANDPQPQVVGAVLDALERVRTSLVDARDEDAFALYVRRTLGPALDRIGMAPARGESSPTTSLRPRLMQWLGAHGGDPKVRARARALAADYVRDPGSVDPSLADVALRLAAREGDAALFERDRVKFEGAKTPVERARYLGALGAFRDTAVVAHALDYVLTGPLRSNDVLGMASGLAQDPRNQDRVYAWMTRHFDAIVAKVPAWAASRVVRLARGCSTERLAAARAFFEAPAHRLPGSDVELAEVGDAVTECTALRAREAPSVHRYLAQFLSAR